MNSYIIAALTAAVGIATTHAHAGDHSHQEKCYGIAKAGQNDCGNKAGTHTCSGKAATDNDPGEYKWVEKGKCKDMGGTTADS